MKRGYLLFFGLFLLARPFFDGLTYPLFQYACQLLILGAALVYAISCLSGRTVYSASGLELPAAFFLLVTLISGLLSDSPYDSRIVLLQYFYYFLLFFLVSRFSENGNIPEKKAGPAGKSRTETFSGPDRAAFRKTLTGVILGTAVLVAAYGIHQHFWGLKETLQYLKEQGIADQLPSEFMSRIISNRTFSTFVYPNVFAAFLIAMIPLALGLIPARPWAEKNAGLTGAAILLVILFGLTLLTTKSGGGLIILFFTGLAWLASFWSGRMPSPAGTAGRLKFPFRKILPFVIIIGGAIILFHILTVSERIPYRNVISMKDRLWYWQSSLKLTAERPVFGFGPGSFGTHYSRVKLPQAMETQHSHSIFFEQLAEGGITGAAAFLWFWLAVFWKTRNPKTSLEKGLFWATLALFLHSQIDFDLADPSLGTYLFVLPALIGTDKSRISAAGKTAPQTAFRVGKQLTGIGAGIIILAIIWAGTATIRTFRAEAVCRQISGPLADGGDDLARLEEAVRINPANPSYWMRLGEIYYQAGRQRQDAELLKKSVEAYRQAVRREPYSAAGRFRFGLAAEEIAGLTGNRNWLETARLLYRQAVYLYPGKKIYREKMLSLEVK